VLTLDSVAYALNWPRVRTARQRKPDVNVASPAFPPFHVPRNGNRASPLQPRGRVKAKVNPRDGERSPREAAIDCPAKLGLAHTTVEDIVKRTLLFVLLGLAAGTFLTLWLAEDASRRSLTPVPRNNEQGVSDPPAAAPTSDTPVTENVAKEGTCRTTPGGEQAGMSHEDCAYIASQIAILPSSTSKDLHSQRAPSLALRPGADLPSDVRELKPLPETVTARLPALKGYQYFLAGQDIVVVGHEAKVAFVVNVSVRPR
jgi:hypothetical protein